MPWLIRHIIANAWFILCCVGLDVDESSIDDLLEIRRLNGDVSGIVQSGVASERPLTEAGLDGQGEVIGLAEKGLDYTHCSFNGANSPNLTNTSNAPPNLAMRKVVQYVAFADDADSTGGTHVAGTIAGVANINDPRYDKWDGMAPGAKIHFFDIQVKGQAALSLPASLATDMFPLAKAAGAAIFLNTWNAQGQTYAANARDVDLYTWENDEFVIIIQAGDNGAAGLNTVNSPGVAKNGITVGSNLRSIEEIAPFSSRGPTADGRIKPDIVATGDKVVSAIAGSACSFGSISGTGMAAALIAGGTALVRQYFRQGWYPSGFPNATDAFTPSGALLKAMILHAGRKMTNISGSTEYPSNIQGFGRVDLDSVLQIGTTQPEQGKLWLYSHPGIQQNSAFELVIPVVNISGAFKVTLVWTDYPSDLNQGGIPGSLRNDLDLSVVIAGVTHHPNGKTTPDKVNNVEMVELSNAGPGNYSLQVSAISITSPTRPGQASPLQPFAVVVTYPSTTTTTTTTTVTTTTTTSTTQTVTTIASGGSGYIPPEGSSGFGGTGQINKAPRNNDATLFLGSCLFFYFLYT